MTPPKVTIAIYPSYPVNKGRREVPTLRYLRHVEEVTVVESHDVPLLCISVNGRILGVVDPWDSWKKPSRFRRYQSSAHLARLIKKHKPPVIFKYQFRQGTTYFPGTVAAGYPCRFPYTRPDDLLTRPRPIDVTARMRIYDHERETVVEQARRLGQEDNKVHVALVDMDRYVSDLWDSQIGFDWYGSGKLTYRMIEYIRAGVVPILHPLGSEWPVRDDAILEDGVHCVYCSDPKEFANTARRLLADPARIERIRRNLMALWETKLGPTAQGYWTWEKLKAAMHNHH